MLTYILFTLRNDLFVHQISSTIHHVLKKQLFYVRVCLLLHETLLLMLKVQGALCSAKSAPQLKAFFGVLTDEHHLVAYFWRCFHLSLGPSQCMYVV